MPRNANHSLASVTPIIPTHTQNRKTPGVGVFTSSQFCSFSFFDFMQPGYPSSAHALTAVLQAPGLIQKSMYVYCKLTYFTNYGRRADIFHSTTDISTA